MSEKNEISRAEMVRLRRESEQSKRMNRIVKEATRPVPPITTRSRPNTPKTKKARPKQNARRRFQVALPSVSNARKGFRSISLPRPQFGWRSVSFILIAVLGTMMYLVFRLPQLRVTEAQVTGNQILTPADVNSVMNIAGRPVFLLSPS